MAEQDYERLLIQSLKRRSPILETEIEFAVDELHGMLVSESLLRLWRNGQLEASIANGEIEWREGALTTAGQVGTIDGSRGVLSQNQVDDETEPPDASVPQPLDADLGKGSR